MQLLLLSVAGILLLATDGFAADKNAFHFTIKTAHNGVISASMQKAGLSVCGKNVLLHIPQEQSISQKQLHSALPELGRAVAERCNNVQLIAWRLGSNTGVLSRKHDWQALEKNNKEKTRSTVQLIAENRLSSYLALSDSLRQNADYRWRTLNRDLNEAQYLQLLLGQVPTFTINRVMRLERQDNKLWMANWPYPARISTSNTTEIKNAEGLFYISGTVRLSLTERDEDGVFLTLIDAYRLESCQDLMCSNLDLALIRMREQLNDPTWEPDADRNSSQITLADTYAESLN